MTNKFWRFVVVAVVFFIAIQAFDQEIAKPSKGVVISGSPVSGWSLDIEKPSGIKSFGLKGSAFELGFTQDRGRDGDWGIVFIRKELNNSSLVGVEIYNFMPAFKAEYIQFGVTVGAGAGVWSSEFSPTGRAEATLAIRPMPAVKFKIGANLDYPRSLDYHRFFGVRFGVNYLF